MSVTGFLTHQLKRSFNKKAEDQVHILCFEISVSNTILIENSCTVKKSGRTKILYSFVLQHSMYIGCNSLQIN